MTTRVLADSAAPTAQLILDVAQRLAQTRGFNGFSYADIAAEVGIAKASLHYHFATKADLGRALVARYAQHFAAALDAIAASDEDAPAKVRCYVDLFESVLVLDRLCLCGMLAAEILTLPTALQEDLRAFFDRSERWLAGVLDAGHDAHTLEFRGSPVDAARYIVGTLEGAMLLAYSYGDATRFRAAAERMLSEFDRSG